MIVIDASVAVKWTVKEKDHERAVAVLNFEDRRVAPDLILPEVANVFRNKVERDEVSVEHTRAAMSAISRAFDSLVPSTDIMAIAMDLAFKLRHPAYDCFYLAVAIGAGILVTADIEFAKRCAKHGYERYIFILSDPLSSLTDKINAIKSSSQSSFGDIQRLSRHVEATFESLFVSLATQTEDKTIVPLDILTWTWGSPAYRALESTLKSLSAERLGAILATAWLAHSHHDARAWSQLLSEAQQIVGEGSEAHSGYIIAHLAHVPKGLQKLREIGAD